jgi:hypothetical protein
LRQSIAILWNDKKVNRSLGIDITKGHAEVVIVGFAHRCVCPW